MKGVPSPSLLGFWPCSSVSPAPLLPSPLSLAGPSPSPAPSALSSPPAWHSLCCGRAQQLPALAWPLGAPVGQGKLGFWDFPGLWPAGSLPLERGTLLLASGQLFSQTKVQGRRLGTPADLYSSGSGFRPQRPREQPQVRVGTRRRHWRAVGETCITPSWIRPPRLWSSGEGALWKSLQAGCVCQAGVAWAQSLDKGLQQRRPSPVGS